MSDIKLQEFITKDAGSISAITVMLSTDKLPYPIGMAQTSWCGGKPKELYFNRLIVSPQYRGNKYGSQMLTRLLELFSEYDLTLKLDINPYGNMDYDSLEKFYLKHGFEKCQIKDERIGDFYTYYYNKKEE